VLSANPIDSSMADGTVGLIGNFDEQQAKKVAQELNG
jgi:hypothetical protein